MKYILYDYYEGRQRVYESFNIQEVEKAARDWEIETDGECSLSIEEEYE